MEMSDRKLKILSAVIDNYIKIGEPVSSNMLCNTLEFPLSSATIRNELLGLTELGFLEQPHTSAGRVPTHLGYRLYISKLMEKASISVKTRNLIDSYLNLHKKNPDQIVKEACHLLAKITNFAVISTNVFTKRNYVKNIHLVSISNYHAMLVLTTSSGIIKTQTFRCSFLLTSEVLDLCANILNRKFSGVLVDDITPAFIQTVAMSSGELSFIMLDVLTALLEAAEQVSSPQVYLDGQANLLLIPEFSHQAVVNVINLFNYSDNIFNLILPFGNKKTQVFIGEENRYEELSQSSIIITKYKVGHDSYGSIGILGPTRMNYAKLIANIEYIAKSMGEILNNLLNLE